MPLQDSSKERRGSTRTARYANGGRKAKRIVQVKTWRERALTNYGIQALESDKSRGRAIVKEYIECRHAAMCKPKF